MKTELWPLTSYKSKTRGDPMMMYFELLLILVLAGAISLLEVPRLLQPEMRGELYAFCGFLLIGIALAMAMTLKLPVPNPTSGIEFVFRPITKLFYPR